MILDENILKTGINAELLAKLIDKHAQELEEYNKMEKYYKGEHEILNRQRASEAAANNKVVCNHAKYITDMTTAYLAGKPVTYTAKNDIDISPVLNEYEEQDISNLDVGIVKSMSIYGRAYELIYITDDTKPRSVKLDVRNTFVVYDSTAEKNPMFGVYYYKKYDVDDNCKGVVCRVYTEDTVMEYESSQEIWNAMELMKAESHYFGGMPIIEYKNNEECQGDFEQIISLIDAYNVLQSDRVNDKEQFVDAFLFLRNIEIDSEQAKKLKEERILIGYDQAAAEYLSKIMSENDIEVLRDCLKSDIHRFSMVPDLSDEVFGNNVSGVAIKYKLLGFEQSVLNKEREVAKGLKKRFILYNNFLSLKGSMQAVPIVDVDIVFTRNLPANELETAQMIGYLKGIVSDATLVSQLGFVTDAEGETEKVREEKALSYREQIEATQELSQRGY